MPSKTNGNHPKLMATIQNRHGNHPNPSWQQDKVSKATSQILHGNHTKPSWQQVKSVMATIQIRHGNIYYIMLIKHNHAKL
jgi:hypothetical protein